MLQLQTQQLKYFKITLYNEHFTDILSNVKTGVIIKKGELKNPTEGV